MFPYNQRPAGYNYSQVPSQELPSNNIPAGYSDPSGNAQVPNGQQPLYPYPQPQNPNGQQTPYTPYGQPVNPQQINYAQQNYSYSYNPPVAQPVAPIAQPYAETVPIAYPPYSQAPAAFFNVTYAPQPPQPTPVNDTSNGVSQRSGVSISKYYEQAWSFFKAHFCTILGAQLLWGLLVLFIVLPFGVFVGLQMVNCGSVVTDQPGMDDGPYTMKALHGMSGSMPGMTGSMPGMSGGMNGGMHGNTMGVPMPVTNPSSDSGLQSHAIVTGALPDNFDDGDDEDKTDEPKCPVETMASIASAHMVLAVILFVIVVPYRCAQYFPVFAHLKATPPTVTHFFHGFRTAVFGRAIIEEAIYLLIVNIGLHIFLLPGLYAKVVLGFALPLILEHGFGVTAAFKTSFNEVHHNLLGIIGLYLSMLFLVMMPMVIGIILCVPFFMGALSFGSAAGLTVAVVGGSIVLTLTGMMALIAAFMKSFAFADLFGLNMESQGYAHVQA
mmetsp:Transcript_20773/g.34231  ORF Transcript_20773/g.34231 Transcript_20773/m.34231 type:complete len:495 (-) Transcript_20773:656-2140(-)